MTATNMCYNFVGFGCSPPLNNVIIMKVIVAKYMSMLIMITMLMKYLFLFQIEFCKI